MYRSLHEQFSVVLYDWLTIAWLLAQLLEGTALIDDQISLMQLDLVCKLFVLSAL